MTVVHDVSSDYADQDTAQSTALWQFLRWRNQGGLVIAIQATRNDSMGRVWEFAAVPICSSKTPAPVLAFAADLEGRIDWEPELLRLQAERLLMLSGVPMFETYVAQVKQVLEENQCFAWYGNTEQLRLEGTLSRHAESSDLPLLLSVADTYAPLAEEWDAEKGSWKRVSLERACELERVDISDLQLHTAYGEAVALVRLIDAVAFGASGIRHIL